MPYPVSPPDPPAIVSSFSSENAATPTLSSTPPSDPATSVAPATHSAIPTLPEAVNPEFAPTDLTTFVTEAAKPRASLLGAPLAVGSDPRNAEPVDPFENPTPVFKPTPQTLTGNQPEFIPSAQAGGDTQPGRRPLQAAPSTTARSRAAATSANLDAWLRRERRELVSQLSATPIAQAQTAPATLQIPSTPLPPESVPDDSPESTDTAPGQPIPLEATPAPSPQTPPTQTPPTTAPGSNAPSPTPAQTLPGRLQPGVIELTADRQEYDEQRQIFTAEGNVMMRYQGALLDADRLQVNLVNRIAVAEGNVALTRGEQVLRGERFEYNFVQETGSVTNARGELFLGSASSDFNTSLPNDASTGTVLDRPLSDRITASQPLTEVTNTGEVRVIAGSRRNVGGIPLGRSGGQVRRLRFEAERIDFTPRQSFATNVRITNDPFSPPELELRTPQATFTRISPLRDEIRATRPRLVFDQGLALPLFQRRIVLDRREREPGLVQFGFDGEDRGGVFVQRNFDLVSSERFRVSLTPQFFVQKAITDGGSIGSLFGLKSRAEYDFSSRTSFRSSVTITSFDPDEIEDQLRARVRLNQLIGTATPTVGAHSVGLEYTYRERIFNGSLGFRTVQSSIGLILDSPLIPLGNTGITLSYQAGLQNISAETDRLELLAPVRENNRVNLTRFQASAALSRAFYLWQGKPLRATATEGLRFTPTPVVPFLAVATGLRGTVSTYSNGDNQNILIGSVGVVGQVGHFSRSFLDYTGFNISYSQLLRNGDSPFLFDRAVDDQVLSFGLVQQIYGPFRIGFQTSVNLDNGDSISTDYFLEYSRRTYGILLRYNPVLEIGSLSLRVSDFNWNGGTEPFSGFDIRPVEGGVRR